MFTKFIGFSLFLLTLVGFSKEPKVTVAVIDTGIMAKVYNSKNQGICKGGHKDFSGSDIFDVVGHGTVVSGLIHKKAKKLNYCQYIVKYTNSFYSNDNGYLAALAYAIDLKPTIINLSLGSSFFISQESVMIRYALDQGIMVVAAAGNDGKELGKKGFAYYPAMIDPRIIVVGALDFDGNIAPFSNFGSIVDYWMPGVAQVGYYSPISMSGTSQATANYTGQLVVNLLK